VTISLKRERLLVNKLLVCSVFAFYLTGCGQRDSSYEQSESRKDTIAAASWDVEVGKRLTYEQRQGKYLYRKYCAVCHGEQGKGDGFNAFNLDPKPRDFTDAKYMNALSDARLLETMNEGGRGVNRSPLMPSWGGRLTKGEQEYLVAFLRRLATN
jgi:mono/diheme cytochrome c family protein